ncbi:restriction endonuclease subunit S [Sporomusa sp. KB1]|jgi:type I restriction enzyme S subunit|uniref:restriction endonuclease subunit S n=1 Tax=Sporomusa sp. KB1 TaxID=943346 RepID=UPI00119E9621|nr:restriction endonuclease subunit S [Sporomusa sp. KB1]TWH49266.1 type I restriction enzyme S subunit [Sporomusa sp. KB1]
MAKKQQLLLEELLEQALVKDEDKPYEVPENWVWVKLDYLCKYIQRGKSPKYSTIESIPVISQKCIQLTGFDLSKARFIDPSTINSYIADRFIQPMDLLWNSTGTGTVGRINCYPGDSTFQKLVADSHVTIIRPIKEKISPKCLLYWLSSPYIQDKIDLLTSGTTNQIELNTTTVKDQQVPLPPLSEQQRIVALIESLFEKLDRAKELAQKALDSFENRKSAILHKAFTGELTKKWREENGVDFERDWEEKKFSSCVLLMQNGISKRGGTNGIDTVVLRLANILDNRIVEDDLRHIKLNEKESEKYLLSKNDLLIIRVNGSLDNVGKFIIVQNENSWAFCDHMIRARINEDIVIAKFVMYFSLTNCYKVFVQTNIVSSAGQNTISQKSLIELQVPVPSLAEQKEIVRILDSIFENEQKAKELCDVIDKIGHMKKAILARAFRGELSTNNPDEESALELLTEVLKKKVNFKL